MSTKQSKSNIKEEHSWVAILGNPNCGKTALFNRLTGLHHKVGNYPGVTVEKKAGNLRGHKIIIEDFPGTYSLSAKSLDEKIVEDMVQSWRNPANRPLAAVVIIDATNIQRNIYLALQILDWNVPTIIVLNMIDEARKKGIKINYRLLKKKLGAYAVMPTSAKTGEGVEKLIETIASIPMDYESPKMEPRLSNTDRFIEPLHPLADILKPYEEILNHNSIIESLRLLNEKSYIKYIAPLLPDEEITRLKNVLKDVKDEFNRQNISYQMIEQSSRFAFIDSQLSKVLSEDDLHKESRSEKFDKIITHRIFGPILLIFVLAFIFNAIFSWAQAPMEWISQSMDWLTQFARQNIPPSTFKSLLIDGIIGGVGSVLVFFPQIILLVLFLSILEDSGYMSRMAFMLDKMLNKIGLHGRSVLPLLSGFACAIPAIMSARTIDSWRDRLVTIMIIPLMSCSARLPIYTILIAAFIPHQTVLGFLSLQSLVLMGIYFLGMFTAILVAMIFKKVFKRETISTMMMELPPYRMPLLRSLWWQLYERGKLFLSNAGSIILAVSIILWFLASFPRPDGFEQMNAQQKIEQSYAGKLGHAIEPAIRPLGFDWKIGIGLITSFAAREVIVSTLSTLYNLEDDGGSHNLIEAMKNDKHPDGRPVFSLLTAISLMVFFAYAAQCMATFAIIHRETNSWRWPFLMVAYMTFLAYLGSLLTYQLGSLLIS
jgi:ferrous iron transport protein B